MMKTIFIVVAFVIFISGIVYSGLYGRSIFKSDGKQVLSEQLDTPTVEENPEEDKKDNGTHKKDYEEEAANSPTSQPKVESTSRPTSEPTPALFLNDFVYPGSETVNSGNEFLRLRTLDNPDKVTDWYKEKIKSHDMNVKSFVTTKANDKVLNKLAGANEKLEIMAEIKKDEGQSFCEINIALSSN